MTTWTEWEGHQARVLGDLEKKEREALRCPKCASEFFEEIKVTRYKEDHMVIIGQQVPPLIQSNQYYLLRCIHCQELLEPRIMDHLSDVSNGEYSVLQDTLEGKNDKRNLPVKGPGNGIIKSHQF